MEPLRKAAELAPANSRYAYVHAVALHSAGNTEAALKILERAHQAHPSDIALLSALVAFNRDAGNREAALKWARQLQALLPDNPEAGRLPQALERDR